MLVMLVAAGKTEAAHSEPEALHWPSCSSVEEGSPPGRRLQYQAPLARHRRPAHRVGQHHLARADHGGQALLLTLFQDQPGRPACLAGHAPHPAAGLALQHDGDALRVSLAVAEERLDAPAAQALDHLPHARHRPLPHPPVLPRLVRRSAVRGVPPQAARLEAQERLVQPVGRQPPEVAADPALLTEMLLGLEHLLASRAA
mmetsp:Transcript_101634/g.270309  ORF Transcript_101634/g.270309 Transcript_101634/m.270309 type:complete len:201 (+) Transcript_101634:538-1140(+)